MFFYLKQNINFFFKGKKFISSSATFFISDNSGARRLNLIKFYKKTPFSQKEIGNLLIGSIRRVRIRKKSRMKIMKKGELKKAILIRTTWPIYRNDGSLIKFSSNAITIVDNKNKPIASRILGVVPLDLKKKKRFKIILLASTVIL